MLPRTHIILGAIFSALIWVVFPETAWYNLILLFLSSFLIDFDHYMCSVLKTGKWSLLDSFKYHKELMLKEKKQKEKGIFEKGDFHVFHTVEFHLLVLAAGFIFEPFLYVFGGMAFHSILDIISLVKRGVMYRREFLFTNWVRRKLSN